VEQLLFNFRSNYWPNSKHLNLRDYVERLPIKKPLSAMLRALVIAFENRAVAIEVAGVNLPVGERAFEVPLDQPSLFSRSPFEIDAEPFIENTNLLIDFAPQIQFPITDYVAQFWSTKTAQGGNCGKVCAPDETS
jgi:hypothetical protein